jgi:hypothetical protein
MYLMQKTVKPMLVTLDYNEFPNSVERAVGRLPNES